MSATAVKKMPNLRKFLRLDGWKNILTGLGIKGADKRENTEIEWEQLTETDAESLYAASDTAGKIVDEIVDDAFREGYALKAKKLEDSVQAAIEDEGQRLRVDEKLQEASRFARLYGGGAVIVMPRDITKLSEPYIPSMIDRIESLLVLTRWELPRGEIEYDVRSPNFNNPKFYRLCPRGGAGQATGTDQMNAEVHHSRVLRFDGSFLPRIKYIANNHWHDSVLNKAQKPIRDYDNALSAISATLDDFSVAVMKMKDLQRSISDDKDDLIIKRMQIAQLGRSVCKTVILDAEAEDYTYQTRTMTGIPECARMVAGRLVVASGMPHTKILGESPEGSQATGNSTTKDWYDHVHAWQKNYLDWRLIMLWTWILSAKQSPTKGKVPVGLKAVYKPLWQEPESVQATMRYNQAQADDVYFGMGALSASEIAVSRFGSGEYSTHTTLEDKNPKDRKPPENT